MAIHAPITGAPLRAPIDLAKFDRGFLADLIAAAIDILDAAEGDPDLELNGDELDGSPSEDDFWPHSRVHAHGPGCPIADPGEDEYDREAIDEREDLPDAISWVDPSRPPQGAQKSFEAHTHRIRETRTFARHYRDWNGQLRERGRWFFREPIAPSLRTLRRRHPRLRGHRALRAPK